MCVTLHKTNLKILNPETVKMKINFEEIMKYSKFMGRL